jgi:hypothetical protein
MKTIMYRNHQISVRPAADEYGNPLFMACNYSLKNFVVTTDDNEEKALEKAKKALDERLGVE